MPNPPASAALVGFWSAGAVLALVGVTVLISDPRFRWNLWLAAFLGLESLTFGLVGALYLGSMLEGAAWLPAADQAVAIVPPFAAAALVVFASVFPRRHGAADSWPGGALLVGVPAVLAAVELRFGGLTSAGGDLAWPALLHSVFVGGCFLWAAHLVTRSYRDERGGVMARQVGIVAFGIVAAALPWAAELGTRVAMDAAALASARASLAVEVLTWPVLLWAGYAVLAPRLDPAGTSPDGRDGLPLRQGLAWTFGAFTALWAVAMVPTGMEFLGMEVPSLARSGAHATILWMLMGRWAVLGAALVVGFRRFGALGVDAEAWRRSVAGVLGIGAVGFVVAAALTVGPLGAGVVAGGLVLVSVEASSPWGAEGRTLASDRARRAYRQRLRESVAEDGDPEDTGLRDLRRKLGIGAREHAFLLALVRAEAEGSPSVAGRYEIRERLGAGAFGSAYLVRDREEDRDLVLKRLHRSLDGDLPDLEVARRVSHPNLVAVHEVLELDEGPAVLMEHVAGGSLRDRLDEDGTIPEGEAARIVRETLDGLAALHRRGIAHGDVKPSNLLLEEDGTVRIADFGLASSSDDEVGRTLGGGAGTPSYMPPDRRTRAEPRPADDLYAAGVLALELLAGDPDAHLSQVGDPDWEAFLERALSEAGPAFEDAEAMRETIPSAPAGSEHVPVDAVDG